MSQASVRSQGLLNKSSSSTSIGGQNEKLQRSQLNIDRKMREDFDRLQAQLAKRMEKEKAVQEQMRYDAEVRQHKANLMNEKN